MIKILLMYLSIALLTPATFAQDTTPDHAMATLRGGPIDLEPQPPRMAEVENDDVKRARSYPMQPPTIPHQIRDYRVDLYSNKCLSCHSRKQTEQSQAPMISVTHYMDREGNFLADVSPRRYFCEQCHVVQTDSPALVGTDFKDIDQLLREQK